MKKRVFAMLLVCVMVVGLVPTTARAYGMGKVGEYQTIAAGGSHSLAIKTDGTLWAWGWNFSGQLGDGTTEERRTPVKVMDNVAAVSAGGNHTLAIKTDGTLWAWGANDAGQLGDGTTENRYTPVKVMDNVATASAGPSSTLVITIDNALWAWGNNQHGHLGDGTTTEHHKPVKVMDGIIGVQTDGATTIALKEDHSLLVWGRNKGSACNVENVISAYTELNANYAVSADGGLWQHHNSQKQAWKLLDNVVTCSISDYASFALKEDGSLWAWGNNINGQITYDTSIARAHSPFYSKDYMTPLQVMSDVVGVDSSLGHTLAIKSDGSLWAWGRNKSGQVGPLADDYIKQRGGDIIQTTPAKVLDNVKLPSSTSGVTQTTLTEKNYPGVPQVVNPSSWAEAEVTSARDNGLIPESLDGNYTGNITRAEFCRLGVALVKGLGKENQVFSKITVVLNGKRFTDTDDEDVLAMCDAGIVNGYGDGRFGPDDPITREQAAVMLARLARAVGKNEADIKNTGFRDGDKISSWAKEDVQFIAGVRTQGGKAVMGGTGGGNFSPKSNYTREQAFITFQRLYDAIKNPYVAAGADGSLPAKPDLERGEQDMAQRAVELVQKLAKLIKQEEEEPFRDKDAELEKLKKHMTAHGMRQEEIPEQVYQAFAMAIYDTLDTHVIKELESDPVKLANQVYDAIKDVNVAGETYETLTLNGKKTEFYVNYEIMNAPKFLENAAAHVSGGTVTWDGKSVKILSTDNEDMKKALAGYCTALAKLNTEVWKDFLAAYFADAFGLMKINIKSKDVKNSLDTAEKVINALNDRNEAKKLVEECFKDTNQAFRDQLLGKWFKNPLANGFVDYIEKALPQGKTIKAGAKCYEKVQKTFEKWREADYAGKDGATLSELYEAFNDAITDMDKLLEEMG